jgi:CheY-like chemotaxis protein
MHGGRITVSSAPGQGSTFSFTLPLATGQTQTDPSSIDVSSMELLDGADVVPLPTENDKKRVLVVDDEPDITSLLQLYLERNGYEVVVAYTGQEALQQVSRYHIDFITLDIMLPDINGLAVLEELRRHEATAQIPVLLLSAKNRDGQLQTFNDMEYMMKPFKQEAVVRIIKNSLAITDKQVVLIADADKESRNFLCQQLQASGCNVIEASSVDEVFAVVDTYSLALILLDSALPSSGCLEVLNTLRSRESTRELPVMLLVSHELNADQMQALLNLQKDVKIIGLPIHIVDVAQAISRQLAEKEKIEWQR